MSQCSAESPFDEDGCIQSLLWWSERPVAQFLGTSYKTRRAKGRISAQSGSCFPITPACSPLSQTPCPSFTTTNTSENHWSYSWSSSMKNDLDDAIHQNWNAQLKKAYLNCILFHCFVQLLSWMSSSWIHHQSVHQTISLQPYLTTDISLELRIGEFIL